MTGLQWLLTMISWVLGVGAAVFALVVAFANSMKTTAPPLSARDAAIAIVPAFICLAVLVVQLSLARREDNFSRTLVWNAPTLCLVPLAMLIVLVAWADHRFGSRRVASERRDAVEGQQNAKRWQRSGSLADWSLTVVRGFQTTFTAADGASRAGVDWQISFKIKGVSRTVTVHSYPATGGGIDLEHHARQVLQRLKHQLDGGWRPESEVEEILEMVVGG